MTELQASRYAEEAATRKSLFDVGGADADAAVGAAVAEGPGSAVEAENDDGGAAIAAAVRAVRTSDDVLSDGEASEGDAEFPVEGAAPATALPRRSASTAGGQQRAAAPTPPQPPPQQQASQGDLPPRVIGPLLRAPPASLVLGFGSLPERAAAGAAAVAEQRRARELAGEELDPAAAAELDAAAGVAAEAAYDALHASVAIPGLGAFAGSRSRAGSGVERASAALQQLERPALLPGMRARFPEEALLVIMLAAQVSVLARARAARGFPLVDRPPPFFLQSACEANALGQSWADVLVKGVDRTALAVVEAAYSVAGEPLPAPPRGALVHVTLTQHIDALVARRAPSPLPACAPPATPLQVRAWDRLVGPSGAALFADERVANRTLLGLLDATVGADGWADPRVAAAAAPARPALSPEQLAAADAAELEESDRYDDLSFMRPDRPAQRRDAGRGRGGSRGGDRPQLFDILFAGEGGGGGSGPSRGGGESDEAAPRVPVPPMYALTMSARESCRRGGPTSLLHYSASPPPPSARSELEPHLHRHRVHGERGDAALQPEALRGRLRVRPALDDDPLAAQCASAAGGQGRAAAPPHRPPLPPPSPQNSRATDAIAKLQAMGIEPDAACISELVSTLARTGRIAKATALAEWLVDRVTELDGDAARAAAAAQKAGAAERAAAAEVAAAAQERRRSFGEIRVAAFFGLFRAVVVRGDASALSATRFTCTASPRCSSARPPRPRSGNTSGAKTPLRTTPRH